MSPSFEAPFFERRQVNVDKLLTFGFVAEADHFLYQTQLLPEDDLSAEVRVWLDGKVLGRVMDTALEEEYLAFRIEQYTGHFVGKVREAYAALLSQMAESCFDPQDFMAAQTQRLAQALSQAFGDGYDHPFTKHPDYISFRVAGKWYALIFPLSRQKLDPEATDDLVEVVNLKVAPNQSLPSACYPSYHMNKKTWISVILDDTLSDETIFSLLVNSRALVAPKLKPSLTEPNFWLIPAKPSYFDVDAAFASAPSLDWHHKGKMAVGDYVGIYLSSPVQCLRYLCQITQVKADPASMTLQLVKTFSDDRFPLAVLKSHEVKAVRGARRMTNSLIEQIRTDLPKTK